MLLQDEIKNKENEIKSKKTELVKLATNKVISNPLKRKTLHTDIVKLKSELRLLKRTLREQLATSTLKLDKITNEKIIPATLNKEEYHKELNIINNIYIKSTTSLRKGNLVTITSKNKTGVIESFTINPLEKNSGIFAKILGLKKNGDVSKKFIRKNRLDTSGWPIEDIEKY